MEVLWGQSKEIEKVMKPDLDCTVFCDMILKH